MKTRNLILAISAAAVLLALMQSCVISRNNPFDPDALRTEIFSDSFATGALYSNPENWSYDEFGASGNYIMNDDAWAPRIGQVCHVDFGLPANESKAIWNKSDDPLAGLIFVKFGFRIPGGGSASISRLAFELTDDSDGLDVKAGFGMYTVDGSAVDFFAESNLNASEPGLATGPIGSDGYMTLYVTFDVPKKTMNAWYNQNGGEMVRIFRDMAVRNLTSGLKRFQFRLFTGSNPGGSPVAEIDDFSISTL